jgi:hypothetical protein
MNISVEIKMATAAIATLNSGNGTPTQGISCVLAWESKDKRQQICILTVLKVEFHY